MRLQDHASRRAATAGWAALAALALACSSPGTDLGPAAPDGTVQAGTELRLMAGDAAFAPGQIVVRCAPGVSIGTINGKYGTQTLSKLSSEPSYLLRVPAGKTVQGLLSQMSADPALEVAEPNYRLENPEAQRSGGSQAFVDPTLDPPDYTDQTALTRIRAPQAQESARGSGVLVAILDSGVAAGHPLLQGRVVAGGWDFVDGDGAPADARDGVDSDADGLVDEAFGHGTFVAGLVLSVAPEASILPVRVVNSDGVGTAFALARGIEHAHRRGARVVNMSLGMSTVSGVVDGLIERIHGLDVVFSASAGNQNVEQPQQFPARDSYVIGTAATDRQDRKAPFSNFGSWVDVSAPGVGLISSFPGGGLARWSGTSFAAALVSGEAALLFSAKPGARFNDVVDAVERSAVSIDDLNPAYDGELGSGRIDVLAAVRWIRQR